MAVGSTIPGVVLARSSKVRNRWRGSSCAGRRISMAPDLYPTCYAAAMDRWLARLEPRIGRYAPSNLTLWIVAPQGVTFAILFIKHASLPLRILHPSAVSPGVGWR